MTTIYRFANGLHSIVLRDNIPIFWHPSANKPADYRAALRWESDGSPLPEPFQDTQEIKDILTRAGVTTE